MNAEIPTQSRIESTARKIADFRHLQLGWHYGSGVVPSDDSISKALALNAEAGKVGFTKTNAFPGIDGEIRVTAYHSSTYLELTVEPNGKITYVLEQDDNEIVYAENLSLDEALERIRVFWGTIWPSLGLSITASTTPTKSVSKVSLSDLPMMIVGFPLLMRSAYLGPAQASVSTSRSSTEEFLETPLFFGTSAPNYFPESAALSTQ